MTKEVQDVTGAELAAMTAKVSPALARLMRSMSEDEGAIGLMAIAAWAVFFLGANFGEDAARQFSLEMARRSNEIKDIADTVEEVEKKNYDA